MPGDYLIPETDSSVPEPVFTNPCVEILLTPSAPEYIPVEIPAKNIVKDPFSGPMYTSYKPAENCSSCAGTGVLSECMRMNPLLKISGEVEICYSHMCMYCPCGGRFGPVTPRTRSSLDLNRKKCSSCGFIYAIDPVLFKARSKVARTQKSIGLFSIKNNGQLFNSLPFKLIQNRFHLDEFADENLLNDRFFRPCPTTPRHGFVESRSCKTKKELVSLAEETWAQDPNGEIVVMERIKATYSAVLVAESGLLAIGPGHDGATSGNNSIVIPVVPLKVEPFDDLYQFLATKERAGVSKKSHSYIEYVFSKASLSKPIPWTVQFRAGPPVESISPDYIPKETKVIKVIKPTNNLLEWEKTVESVKGVEGVVAYKKDASLACHAAVHCVAAGIPFITTKCPRKGTVLKNTVKVFDFDQAEYDHGFKMGWFVGPCGMRNTTPAAVAIVHNIAALKSSPYYSRLIGFAAAAIFRAGALACIGELRHIKNTEPASTYATLEKKDARLKVWQKNSKHSPRWLAQKLGRASIQFMKYGWTPSMGGQRWANACLSNISLYKSIVSGDMENIIQALNIVINTCHNGGKLLNKFVEGNEFDLAAVYPGIALTRSSPTLFNIIKKKPFETKLVCKPYVSRAHKIKLTPEVSEGEFYGHVHIRVDMPAFSKKAQDYRFTKFRTISGPWKEQKGYALYGFFKQYLEIA